MIRVAKKYFIFFCCFTQLIARGQTSTTLPPGLDKYLDSVLRIFEVPGISLAIVKDGKVLLAKGYGVKKTSEKVPVTEHTLFSIASNTKAFTAVALAILFREKKRNWADPGSITCPGFACPIHG